MNTSPGYPPTPSEKALFDAYRPPATTLDTQPAHSAYRWSLRLLAALVLITVGLTVAFFILGVFDALLSFD